MNELKPVEHLGVQCVHCGKPFTIHFQKPVYIIEGPKIACSNYCLNEWEKSVEKFISTQAR